MENTCSWDWEGIEEESTIDDKEDLFRRPGNQKTILTLLIYSVSPTVKVFQGCCNKESQIGLLKTTKIDPLTVEEARSPESKCQSARLFPLEIVGKDPSLALHLWQMPIILDIPWIIAA